MKKKFTGENHLIFIGLAVFLLSGQLFAKEGNRNLSCHPHFLEMLWSKQGTSVADKKMMTSRFLDHCKDYYKDEVVDRVDVLKEMQDDTYPFDKLPQVKDFKYKLPSGLIVEGKVALKDNTKRPMIIILPGKLSDYKAPGSIQAFKYLFEQGPFHVLILNNITSEQFMVKNRQVLFGSVEEAHHLYGIAEAIKKNEFNFSHLVETLHVYGESLGGQATLYASIYNSQARDPALDSVLVGCPPANLFKATDGVFNRKSTGSVYSTFEAGKINKAFHKKAVDHFESVLAQVPSLERTATVNGRTPEKSEWTNMLAESSYDHYVDRIQKTWPSLFVETIAKVKPKEVNRNLVASKFWQWNNVNNYHQFSRTPALVYSSDDDFVVESAKHAHSLEDHSKNNPTLNFIRFKGGSHCALHGGMGHALAGSFMRGYFLGQAKKPSDYVELQTPELSKQGIEIDLKEEYLKDFSWSYNESTKSITLQFVKREKGVWFTKLARPIISESFTIDEKTLGLEVPVLSRGASNEEHAYVGEWIKASIVVLNKDGKDFAHYGGTANSLLVKNNSI